jgi:hypothetical protein
VAMSEGLTRSASEMAFSGAFERSALGSSGLSARSESMLICSTHALWSAPRPPQVVHHDPRKDGNAHAARRSAGEDIQDEARSGREFLIERFQSKDQLRKHARFLRAKRASSTDNKGNFLGAGWPRAVEGWWHDHLVSNRALSQRSRSI